MEDLLMANAAVVGLNAVLLLVLLRLYVRMMRDVPSRFTLGLALFATVMLVQSAAQLYFYLTMQAYFAGGVVGLVLIQNILATLAIGFLTWVTYAPEGTATPRPARTAP